jgi:hypothetical protein
MMEKADSKYKNYILTFAVLLLNVVVMAVCFDFYYDLNDDVMMKDIMSGAYTGTPDGHNMQTLYLLGALIALCYRLCRAIPWYGLFLCLCQFGCFYLLGARLTELVDKKWLALLLLTAFQWGVCLPHLINVQYTITCAMMSATAIFLFYTTPETEGVKEFIVKNIPAMLLVIVAYQLRTEMLLLSLPFVALAGIFRWGEEGVSQDNVSAGKRFSLQKMFGKDNVIKYGSVIGVILLGMLLSYSLDFAAYGSLEWKDFRDFFDARTTVYDFYPELVTQDEHSNELSQLGVTDVQKTLLRNYNFGLDEKIDTNLLGGIAGYAKQTFAGAQDWGAIFREKARLYLYRSFHDQDAPYNMIVLWAYAAVLLAGFHTRQSKLPQLALLLLTRTAIWMFVLMRGRDPERITHSLYLIEFALLAAMFVRSLQGREAKSPILHGMKVCFVLFVAVALVSSVQKVQTDQILREAVNQNQKDIDAYCRAHAENFYFEDVYSTVSFSQKMFEHVDNTYANYDILGGWMCKSPLYLEKLSCYTAKENDTDVNSAAGLTGSDGAADTMLRQDNVYLIMSDTEAADQGFAWLTDYYAEQGVCVRVEEADVINENYKVYRVESL